MSVGWQIALGIISLVVGVTCFGTFIPITAVAIYHGWDACDDIVIRGRGGTVSENLIENHARWRQPAWHWGWWLRERSEDRREWQSYHRQQRS